MNGRFHNVMIAAAGNIPLKSALHQVNQHPLAAPNSIVFRTTNLERLFGNMRQAQQEHSVIVEALKSRQVTRAEALMAEHIYRSREIVHNEIREKGPALSDFFRKNRVA